MAFQSYPELVALAVATLFTPGPNNAMLAASGANFGFRRTLPHGLGVALGFPLMLLMVGLALGGLFQTSTLLREGLRFGGAVVLLWIAWRIASSGGAGGTTGAAQPMRFVSAAGFQWINPKAWSMAVAATSQFVAPDQPFATASVVAATFLTLALMSCAIWILAGQAIARWLTTTRRQRVFNLIMAGLIVASIVSLLAH